MAIETDRGLKAAPAATEALDALCRVMRAGDIDRVLAEGLHEFLDQTQARLNAITAELARSFFGHAA